MSGADEVVVAPKLDVVVDEAVGKLNVVDVVVAAVDDACDEDIPGAPSEKPVEDVAGAVLPKEKPVGPEVVVVAPNAADEAGVVEGAPKENPPVPCVDATVGRANPPAAGAADGALAAGAAVAPSENPPGADEVGAPRLNPEVVLDGTAADPSENPRDGVEVDPKLKADG